MDFDSSFLKECVGLNLSGFGHLRERFTENFGLNKTSGKHTPANARNDINRLGRHYHEANILSFCPGRKQPYEVPNEFGNGVAKLHEGQLHIFLDRTLHGVEPDTLSPQETMSDSDINIEGGISLTNPITLVDGVASLTHFNSPISEDYT